MGRNGDRHTGDGYQHIDKRVTDTTKKNPLNLSLLIQNSFILNSEILPSFFIQYRTLFVPYYLWIITQIKSESYNSIVTFTPLYFFTPSLCPQQHVSGHRVHTGLPGVQAGRQGIGGLRNFHTVRMGKCSELYLWQLKMGDSPSPASTFFSSLLLDMVLIFEGEEEYFVYLIN